MISTFLEKKSTVETSQQEEEIVGNVAFTVYGGSCVDESAHTIYTLHNVSILQRHLIL